ncbi:glycosyltransferase family 41 protein [Polynucleobacter sp. AP-Reno-20A-A9]|uniref:tetratricopeptide repeat protein n=1 Tax=Polynucleobacter sp. AP-Reno-20A-A9 TaxID=2576925 RepID=UPI001C0B4F9E|nr:glycosyltransferase family 41 protein [Polynucleobacter sp. AP-Reno-20A-A9]MBU3627450.1 tetratricopeptide repeat protein [Polynucleobacter sp. AP-Reno-20A-A9]
MSNRSQQETREQSQLIFQNGLVLLQQGKLEEADKHFLLAHQLDENNVDALNLLGIRSYQKQHYSTALDFLNRANRLAPDSAQTLSNLGLVHHALLEYAEALQFFNLAIQCDSNIPETHNNRGNALKGLGKNDEANKAYESALALRPNYAEALSNQGILLLEMGKTDKAIAILENAIQANPHFAIAYNNLGNAFTQIEHYDDAFQCFERALQINPHYLDACLNFGNSLKKYKQYEAAIDCYQHALKINSGNAKTFYLLGEIYYDIGDGDLAKTYYAKSLELDTADIETHIALTIAQIPKVAKSEKELSHSRGTFTQQLEFVRTIPQQKIDPSLLQKLIARHPFYLAYQDEDNKPLLSQFGAICAGLARPLQDRLDAKQSVSIQVNSKIQVGIISSFICSHPVWHAITKGWVNQLNPDQFELHIFNTNGIEDEETQLAKSRAASYSNCGTDVLAAAQIIANQNLDVVLYPEIGMDTVSKALACLRLAPLQVVSWGHPETTGIPTIDAFLSAELLEPDDAHSLYSEEIIKLPNLGTYVEYQNVVAQSPNLESLGIDPSLPILLCAGSPSKYMPSHDFIFIEIAKKLGQCQFIFFNFEANLTSILKERLQLAFANAQLDANQFLRFIPFLKKEEFHGLMQKADLYLDTIGFSGFNTALQAIACDLPVVTIEGARMRGRLASAILHRIGLEDMVCRSVGDYIHLVVELIQNPELLNSYRDKIAQPKVLLLNDLEPITALEDFLIQQTRK